LVLVGVSEQVFLFFLQLGWKPAETFETGLAKTIDWYLANAAWLKSVTSGTYQAYYDAQYASA